MTEIIKIDNFISSGSIYFHTRHRLSLSQVSGLKYVDGVTRYETHNYYVSISVGSAFGFVEVASRALLLIADALGVSLNDLEVTTNHESPGNDQLLINRALVEAKKLDRNEQIIAKQAEIERIDTNVASWRNYVKHWLTRRRQLVRELKKLEQQG